MVETLHKDPAVADSLASRILRSALGERISGATDPDQRLRDVHKWIDENPGSAAHVAVGLAQDDAEGGRRFEEAVVRNTGRKLQIDPDHVSRSTYGRLKRGSLESKLMSADAEMTEEEKREILKSMFEGQGNMSSQIITQGQDGKRPGAAGAAAFSGGYYDRLSRLNLRGYSPQVMAIQSALNQRRAPGAPKLRETGKLDYETLSYPAYGMRYDLRNLEARLRYQHNLELARRAGLAGRYRPEQLLSPEVEARLKRKAAGAKLDPGFSRRAGALERAAAALRGFEAAALPARDPANLTRRLLLNLGAKQHEAARWITVASLEEDIQRLDSEEGFLSPELLALIDACPLPEATRAAYKRRGEGYHQTLLKMKAKAAESVRKLEADDWKGAVGEVAAALAENATLRRDLSRNIRDFVDTPYRLRALYGHQPRWRDLLEGAVERYLPSTKWGRQLRERRAQRETLQDVFGKIATGDLDAAHAILTAGEPSGPAARR